MNTIVLTYEKNNEIGKLKLAEITNNVIPESINGESGFHVYHVRVLTELMLKQLQKISSYSLSDDEIEAISIASSLHDIGKMKIPKSILDNPGRLSPMEYDIVKKHTVFGEEIIDEIQSDIDPKIIKYAKQIARYHHERYDGTGYPDGVKGENIPISAQVVSITDVFDALTSERSYKRQFSQDVAMEMIINGKCGVFNSVIVECLLQVVNQKELVNIRENFKKGRSIVWDENMYTPKNVLLVGNTGYITQNFIQSAFEDSNVTIVGPSMLNKAPKLKVYSRKNAPIKSIFETYDFDTVIYLSGELTYDTKASSDSEDLRNVLKYTCANQSEAKFIYFSSLDGAFEKDTDKGVLCRAKESLCEYFHNELSMDIKVVRVPYLYSGTYKNDYLYNIFEQISKGKMLRINEYAESRCYFLSTTDLGELIHRLTDNWMSQTGIITINDEYSLTFGGFVNELRHINNKISVDYICENNAKVLGSNNVAVRNEYGWFSKHSIFDELETEYNSYLASKKTINISIWEKIKNFLAKQSIVLKITELILLFILTEHLVQVTDSTIIFSLIDFRMAFIVIMGTIHGLSIGLASAGLSSIAWLVAKIVSGTSPLTIFYEPTNWLVFVFYFFVGALCGYSRIKSMDKIQFLNDQNHLLEDKLVFTRELYSDIYNEKKNLKKQIMVSKESFGKLYDITQKLDTIDSRELYLKIVDTFEETLENRSICVYSVNDKCAFARLQVASRDIISNIPRSISLEEYKQILENLSVDDVWKNSNLLEGFPMYASGIFREGKLKLLVMIMHTEPHQRSLYYANLFKILCDLAELSLLRSYDYHEAIYEKEYIEGTQIYNSDTFNVYLNDFKNLYNRKVFTYIHFKIGLKGHFYSEASKMLSKIIRANDVLGITKNGELHLLLSQASEEDLKYILPRFEGIDLDIDIIND